MHGPSSLQQSGTSTMYRAVAIRFGVIRLVVCEQERYTLGGAWGACSPRKILKYRGYEIVSETNFGPI